jgi:hypothetical protein
MDSREMKAPAYKNPHFWIGVLTLLLSIPAAVYYFWQVSQVPVVEIHVTNTENDTFEIPLPALGLRVDLLVRNRTPHNIFIEVLCNDTGRLKPIGAREVESGGHWNFTHEVLFTPEPMRTMHLLFTVRDPGSHQDLVTRVANILFVPWRHAARLSSYDMKAGDSLTRTVLIENQGADGNFLIVREVWRVVDLGTSVNPITHIGKYYNETMTKAVQHGQTYAFKDTFRIDEPGLYVVRTFVSKILPYEDDILVPCPSCALYWQLSDGSSNLFVWVSQ